MSNLDHAPVMEEVEINGEKVLCRRVDLLKEFGHVLTAAPRYEKVGTVTARRATQREVISTGQDGTTNVAEPGDMIIHNPGDRDPYVFGNKSDTVEVRNTKFAKKYEAIDEKPGFFKPKGVIRALQVNENLVFGTSWGQDMSVKAGGWITDGGYSIAADSFESTYRKLVEE